MWTRERNHMVYTEPWVYVAQMQEPAGAPRRISIVRRVGCTEP